LRLVACVQSQCGSFACRHFPPPPLYFPQHVLMKFSSKLSREDNQALLRAGIILVAGL
jgi:hypothetical protein